MKFKVAKDFIEKATDKYHAAGSEYETADKERAAFLQKEGFLEADENTTVKGEKIVDPKYQSVLDQTAAEILDLLPGTYSKEDHEELMRIEKEAKKPRKTVIEHIEKLLKGEDNESGEA